MNVSKSAGTEGPNHRTFGQHLRKGIRVRLQLRSGARAHRNSRSDDSSDAKAAVDKTWDAWEFKKVEPKSEASSTGEGRNTCSFRIPHGPLPSETLRACEIQTHRERRALEGQRQGLWKKSIRGAKEHQVRRQRHAWIRCPDSLAWLVRPTDAVSAYTQVHLSDAPRLLPLSEKERPQEWIRVAPSRRPKHWDSLEEPVGPFERNPIRSPLGRIAERKKTGEVLFKETVKKLHRESQLFLSVSVVQKKENVGPIWTILREEIDLENKLFC